MTCVADNHTSSIPEAFIYIWNDSLTGRIYLGYHKGTFNDGYVCSQPAFEELYYSRPATFSRVIIHTGLAPEMNRLENMMLWKVDAKHNPLYYNNSSGAPRGAMSEEANEKRRKSLTGRVRTKEHSENISKAKTGKPNYKKRGQKQKIETKQKISQTRISNKVGVGEKNSMYGKNHREDSKIRMGLTKKKRFADGTIVRTKEWGLAHSQKMKAKYASGELIPHPREWTDESREVHSKQMKQAHQDGRYDTEAYKNRDTNGWKPGHIPWNKGLVGLTESDETCKKKSIAAKKRWAKLREEKQNG